MSQTTKKDSHRISASEIKVHLGNRSYTVVIGDHLESPVSKYLARFRIKKAVIFYDAKLAKTHRKLKSLLASEGVDVVDLRVQAGEELKDFKNLYPLYGKLLRAGVKRDAVLFAIGGGSVGDAAGFLASTYMRGLAWVGVPTTLLAQVDSSVGGKTGINHDQGKNLIGSFHQPSLVLCDLESLRTLSHREKISGFGEMIKYGIVYDPKLYQYLVENHESILDLDKKSTLPAIRKCLEWKAQVVSKDEFDRLGKREFLNFGHTFGHALEALTHYKKYQHGEAVIWGMRFALALSEVRGHLSARSRESIDQFLKNLDIGQLPPRLDHQRIFKKMNQDKKVRNGKIHFVLLKKIGKPIIDAEVTQEDLASAFELLRKVAR